MEEIIQEGHLQIRGLLILMHNKPGHLTMASKAGILSPSFLHLPLKCIIKILSRTPVYQSQGDENSLVSSFTGSSTIRSHSSDGENGELTHSRSPYQTKRTSAVGKVRYEPVYLREILNSDLGYPTSTPVSCYLHLSVVKD
jgi:hypothetical protein